MVTTSKDWKKLFHEALAAGKKQTALRLLEENGVFKKRPESHNSSWKRDTHEETGPHILQLWGKNEIHVSNDLLSFDIADLGDDNVAIAMLYEDRNWRSNQGYCGGIGWYWKGEVAVLNLDKGVSDTNVTETLCVRDPDNGYRDIHQYINKDDILRIENGRATVRLGSYASASVLINGVDLNNKQLVNEEFVKELKRDKKDYAKIRVLLEAGANPNISIYGEEKGHRWSTTPLRALMEEHHFWNGFHFCYDFHDYKYFWTSDFFQKEVLKTIELLLKKGANLNYCDDVRRKTPLMMAIDSHCPDFVKLFVKYGANVEQQYHLHDAWDDYMASMATYANENLGCPEEICEFIKEELNRKQQARAQEEAEKTMTKTENSKKKPSTKKAKTSTPKPLSLVKKGKILDAASAPLRHKRETLLKQASELGVPLSKEQIRKMRDDEGRARAKKLKELLKNNQTTPKRAQHQK